MQNLKEHLDKFNDQKVLVLGDVFVDEYVYGDCTRMSPEAPVPVFLVDPSKTKQTLGGAANTAANIKSLGGEVILIGRAGNDRAGDCLSELCRKQGINYTGVPQVGPTTRKTRVVAQRQQILRMDKEVVEPSGKLTEEIILALFKKALPFCDIVVLSDYAKGFFTPNLCQKIIHLAKVQDKKVIVDPKAINAEFYMGATFITPNLAEAKGIAFELYTTIPQIPDVLDVGVLLTMGAGGLKCMEAGQTLTCPTTPKDAFDVSGAGDTVVAAFSLSLASGLDVETAMQIANRAAGIAVTKFGTYAVTKEDMLNA